MSESERSATAGEASAREPGWRGAARRLGRALDHPLAPERLAFGLAALVLAVGVLGGLTSLGRDPWLDEFWTLASSRPDLSPREFLAIMAGDVHPILYYGLAYVSQSLGLSDLPALRTLNIAGVALAGWALWLAYRRRALTGPQAAVVAALYASSSLFFDYFAELRAYFLVHSSSLALTLVWRVMARDVAEGRRWSPGVLAAWLSCLAVFVNLHYFATLLGGALTLSLVLMRRSPASVLLAAASLLAAAPAVALALVQRSGVDGGLVAWVQTGRVDAAFVMLDVVWAAAAFNVVALGCAIAGLLEEAGGPDRARLLSARRDELILAVVMCAYFAALLAINLVRPVVVDRYLVAASGPIVVGLSLLAAGQGAPRWGAAAACLFALAVQAREIYTRSYPNIGWGYSAALVADIVQECPTAQVFIDPAGSTPETVMATAARRRGLLYYAQRFGIPVGEVGPGSALPAPGACPVVVWLEHYGFIEGTSGAEALQILSLEAEGRAEVFRVGSGTVVVVN